MMKKVPHGVYSEYFFAVEPQVAWLTASELGLNVWTSNPSIIYKFIFCFEITSSDDCSYKSIKQEIDIKENTVIRFGPLTDVMNINKSPKENRNVIIKIFSNDEVILKLKYRIPEFWPLTIPKKGDNIPTFRVTIGSCLRMSGDTGAQPIFPSKLFEKFKYKIIENKKHNNLTFLLGDTVYLNNYNYDTKNGIIARYRQLQNLPELNGAWSSSSSWSAIIDDHDVSINDGTLGSPSLNLCKNIFSQIWPSMNPVNEISPLTFAFSRFDISFIGLDNRSYRTNPGDDSSTILGEKQFIWLKQCIYSILELGGPNTIIFISVGTPLIPPGPSSFLEYPNERQRILDMINGFGLKNVFILSGDSHFSDVSVLGNIIEIRNSALSSKPRNPEDYPNPYRVPGSAVGVNNFSTLDILGKFLEREIHYKTYDKNGIAYETVFKQKE